MVSHASYESDTQAYCKAQSNSHYSHVSEVEPKTIIQALKDLQWRGEWDALGSSDTYDIRSYNNVIKFSLNFS